MRNLRVAPRAKRVPPTWPRHSDSTTAVTRAFCERGAVMAIVSLGRPPRSVSITTTRLPALLRCLGQAPRAWRRCTDYTSRSHSSLLSHHLAPVGPPHGVAHSVQQKEFRCVARTRSINAAVLPGYNGATQITQTGIPRVHTTFLAALCVRHRPRRSV